MKAGNLRQRANGKWQYRKPYGSYPDSPPPWYITERASWWNTICLIISLNRKKS